MAWAAHGGGAFSGKDPSQRWIEVPADTRRSWVAKNLVAAGIAEPLPEVQLGLLPLDSWLSRFPFDGGLPMGTGSIPDEEAWSRNWFGQVISI